MTWGPTRSSARRCSSPRISAPGARSRAATNSSRATFPSFTRSAARRRKQPRLVDFVWGRGDAPKVTLVGKGVTFDTGGLDIKPAIGHGDHEKGHGRRGDGLAPGARMIMEAKLDVRLRVLVPIVENAISASAIRPGDVLKSRKGLTVEIGNTDAEGRLILADALASRTRKRPRCCSTSRR